MQLSQKLRLFLATAAAIFGAAQIHGFDHPTIVAFEPVAGGFPLAEGRSVAALVVHPDDAPGVARAAGDLQEDIEKVTGTRPSLIQRPDSEQGPAVLIGTLGHSPMIDRLVTEGLLDDAAIRGKWEAFTIQVVRNPLPGVPQALVIAGSDRRGTIFGIYEISEQIGVSPWNWWADVPVIPRETLHVRPDGLTDDGPAVQYRGIFLNDEAPALTGWVHEKFGAFNHEFYAHVFELLLRLRANYLWPAMWLPRAFNDDDPENPRLADAFGIVMGTSHHEPMMRAHDEWGRHGEGPWDYTRNEATLQEFWRNGLERVKDYEGIITIGMRGDGDEEMTAETNTALLERIVRDQREIIADVTGQDPAEVPQVWALYKEVQDYYEAGMRVPDDVTLLWADDNWGNIRRLPAPSERGRAGGAGVYYHFDYVGGPRNYKWMNVTPLSKVWEQMHLAWQYDATRIWIVNVGDLKPMEFPIDFFLRYAWDPERWPYEKLTEFSEMWAAQQFGREHAAEIASLMNGYTKLNRLRTPELMQPDTFSVVNYREAERIEAMWDALIERAERVAEALPDAYHDAYFQLVLYPVKASAGVQKLYIATGRNRLYVEQGRVQAQAEADKARALFQGDRALVDDYHALGDGRWNHMMSQIKFGYTYWQSPELEAMPAVHDVHPRWGSAMAIAVEGSRRSWPYYNAPAATLPPIDFYHDDSRWIDVFNRGMESFQFRARADQPWIRISPSSGTVEDGTRLEVSVADWDAVPAGTTTVTLTIEGSGGGPHQVAVPVRRPDEPLPEDFRGFISNGEYVAMEAPHFQRAVDADGVEWRVLEDFGRSVGGVTAFPVTAPEAQPGGDSPRLEYDFHVDAAGEVTIELQCAPSLDFQPGEGLRVAISLNDQAPRIVPLDTWETLRTWEEAVANNTRKISSKHRIEQAGAQTLKIWYVTPGVVLQRIVIDQGGVRPSYFGPPESAHIQ